MKSLRVKAALKRKKTESEKNDDDDDHNNNNIIARSSNSNQWKQECKCVTYVKWDIFILGLINDSLSEGNVTFLISWSFDYGLQANYLFEINLIQSTIMHLHFHS